LLRSPWPVNLTDVKLETGRDLLFYLYNGRIKPDSDFRGLLILAKKYNIPVGKILSLER
jgi:hypothetical protein